MATAYVLINTETGSEDVILQKMKEMPNVKEAYELYGVHDMIAKVEAESREKLKKFVGIGLRNLDKVRSVLTLVCNEGE